MNDSAANNDLSGIGLSIEQERLVIRSYLIYSIIITSFYAILTARNILLKSNPEDPQLLIGTLILIGIFCSYFLLKNHLFAKNYITIIFSLVAGLSFFSFKGITGLFTIDLINVIIFTFIIFNIKSLVRYGIYYLLLFSGLIMIQLNDFIPMSENVVYFNTKIDAIIFVITRLILTVNMILYMKYRHNIERLKLIQINTDYEKLTDQLKLTNDELKTQNEETTRQKKLIDDQNKKLKKVQQEIRDTNDALEERILIRTEELINVNKKLKKTLTELDRFVYSASHDLSAPLKSILGLVHVAQLEDTSCQLTEHFSYIKKSIQKQDKIIKNLIQYSRNNRNTIVITKIDLDLLIDDVLSELRFYPGYKELKIQKKLSVGHITTDESRIRTITNNLLSNAIKYRDQNKTDPYIKITTRKENGSWELEVEDNGQGIGNEEKSKIFDMFYRANEFSDGSGLGLFIVAEAVEKLNGSIQVKSRLEEGSIFTMSFPIDT